jgi:hypothetical protein
LIRRKAHSRSESKKVQQQQFDQNEMPFDGEGISTTDAEYQRFLRDDFERRLTELESHQARILELENQQQAMSRENSALKLLVTDTRSKMERVLKMLYQAFVNSSSYRLQNSNGKVLSFTVIIYMYIVVYSVICTSVTH